MVSIYSGLIYTDIDSKEFKQKLEPFDSESIQPLDTPLLLSGGAAPGQE